LDPATVDLSWAEPDYDGLEAYLTGHSFNAQRVAGYVVRLRKCRGTKTQGRIDAFFGKSPHATPEKSKAAVASKLVAAHRKAPKRPLETPAASPEDHKRRKAEGDLGLASSSGKAEDGAEESMQYPSTAGEGSSEAHSAHTSSIHEKITTEEDTVEGCTLVSCEEGGASSAPNTPMNGRGGGNANVEQQALASPVCNALQKLKSPAGSKSSGKSSGSKTSKGSAKSKVTPMTGRSAITSFFTKKDGF